MASIARLNRLTQDTLDKLKKDRDKILSDPSGDFRAATILDRKIDKLENFRELLEDIYGVTGDRG